MTKTHKHTMPETVRMAICTKHARLTIVIPELVEMMVGDLAHFHRDRRKMVRDESVDAM